MAGGSAIADASFDQSDCAGLAADAGSGGKMNSGSMQRLLAGVHGKMRPDGETAMARLLLGHPRVTVL